MKDHPSLQKILFALATPTARNNIIIKLRKSCSIMTLIFAFGITATRLGFAQEDSLLSSFDERITVLETKLKKASLYNGPSRAEVVNGYHLFLTGEFLYLQPEENGLSYTIRANNPHLDLPKDRLVYKNLDFDYDIGFRVGMGYSIPHDHWDLYAVWTHYNTDASGECHAEEDQGLFPIWTSLVLDPDQPLFVTDADAKWRLNLNIIDVELGKEYAIGKHLDLRPSMGVRTAFIDQHYHILYAPVPLPLSMGSEFIHLHNNFWGVGPKGAINTQWSFGAGFHLYGSAALSLLFGEFQIHSDDRFEAPLLPEVTTRHDFHQVRAIADLAIGLGWDLMLAHDQYHLGIRAGYEQHLYFGQNLFDRAVYNVFASNFISNLGDLSLQGWTASLRVDF